MLDVLDANCFRIKKHDLPIRANGKNMPGITRKNIGYFNRSSMTVVAFVPLFSHGIRVDELNLCWLSEHDLESTNHPSPPPPLVILHYENGYQDWYPGWELHPRLLYRRGGTSYGLTYCREVFFYKTDEVGLSRIRTYTLRPSRARVSCSLLVKALSG